MMHGSFLSVLFRLFLLSYLHPPVTHPLTHLISFFPFILTPPFKVADTSESVKSIQFISLTHSVSHSGHDLSCLLLRYALETERSGGECARARGRGRVNG